MLTALKILETFAPDEYAWADDNDALDELQQLAKQRIRPDKYGTNTEQARGWFMAHVVASLPTNQELGSTSAGQLSSKSVGDISLAWAQSTAVEQGDPDGDLVSTSYGEKVIALRKTPRTGVGPVI